MRTRTGAEYDNKRYEKVLKIVGVVILVAVALYAIDSMVSHSHSVPINWEQKLGVGINAFCIGNISLHQCNNTNTENYIDETENYTAQDNYNQTVVPNVTTNVVTSGNNVNGNQIVLNKTDEFNPSVLNITSLLVISNLNGGVNAGVRLSSKKLLSGDFYAIAWGDNSVSIVHDNGTAAHIYCTYKQPTNCGNLTIFTGNQTAWVNVYHDYSSPGTYNVTAADLSNYSNTIQITLGRTDFSQRFLIVQVYNTYEYIPINTTNSTLSEYICEYAPIAINTEVENQSALAYLNIQKAVANEGYRLLHNDSSLRYYEGSDC